MQMERDRQMWSLECCNRSRPVLERLRMPAMTMARHLWLEEAIIEKFKREGIDLDA